MALTWEEMNKIIDAKGPELLKKLCECYHTFLIPFTDWAHNAHSVPFGQSKNAHSVPSLSGV